MEGGGSGDRTVKATEDERGIEKEGLVGDSGIRKRIVCPSSVYSSSSKETLSGSVLDEFEHHDVLKMSTTEEYGSLTTELEQGSGTQHDHESHELGAASRHILQPEGGTSQSTHQMRRKRKSNQYFKPIIRLSSLSPVKKSEEEYKKGTSILVKKAWTTADAVRHDSAYIIFAMRDFAIYIIFLLLLLMITFGNIDHAYNYYANLLSDLITKSKFETHIGEFRHEKTLDDLRSKDQVWDFIDGVLLKVLYNEKNDRVLRENIFVGYPAIRQVRVKNGTCQTAAMFRDLYKTCYDYFSKENEDGEPFGLKDGTAWRSNKHVNVPPMQGLEGLYSHGEFEMNFTADPDFTKAWLKELKDNLWIQPGTRLVVIDFGLYSPNTNSFLIVKLMFEMLPVGGVLTSSTFVTTKFIRYLTPWNCFILSCEFFFMVFTVYFTLEELQQIWLLREDYLTNWWNVLDLTIILLAYSVIYCGLQRLFLGFGALGSAIILIYQSEHGIFDTIMVLEDSFTSTCAVLSFFAWLKLFKFTTLNKSILLILSALENVAYELFFITIMILITAVGFSILGFTLFGAHVAEFKGMSQSFFTMVSLFVGRIYYVEECLYAQGRLATLFFGAYIILTLVIFLNAYVALIVYGYHNTRTALHEEPNQQYLSDLLYSFIIEVLLFFWRYKMIKRLDAKALLAQNQRDYDAFVAIFKRHGWHGMDLRLFLTSHGLKRGNEMSLDHMTEVYNDFCLRYQLYIEVEGHNQIIADLEKIEKTLDFFDQTILDINSKADILIDKVSGSRSTTQQ